nr:hypothetical protein [Saprospiraceae bacterium]
MKIHFYSLCLWFVFPIAFLFVQQEGNNARMSMEFDNPAQIDVFHLNHLAECKYLNSGNQWTEVTSIFSLEPDYSVRETGVLNSDQLNVKVRGTGQTIGQVLLLEIKNRDNNRPGRMTIGPVLVPGKGKTQAYVIPGTTEVEVPPGGTITVPVDGICIDPDKPPLGSGDKGTDFGDWISINPLPDDWEPNPTTGWEPDLESPLLNPITENDLNHVIDIAAYPEEVADLIGNYVGRIIDTYDYLSNVGEIITPLTDRPLEERNAVIQQLVWRAAAALSGDEFTQTEWGERIFDQLPETGGNLNEEEKENINAGIQDFWNIATLVGVEAKVISKGSAVLSPEKTDEDDEDNREACSVSSFEFNIKIQVITPAGESEEITVDDQGDFMVGRLLPGTKIKVECEPEVECECVIQTRRRTPGGGTSTQTFTSPCNPNRVDHTKFNTSDLSSLTSEKVSQINEILENEEESRLEQLKEELLEELAGLRAKIEENQRIIDELRGTREREERERRNALRGENSDLERRIKKLDRDLNRSDSILRRSYADRLEEIRNKREAELWRENGCNLELIVEGRREDREVDVSAKITIVAVGECGSDYQSRCKPASFTREITVTIKSR